MFYNSNNIQHEGGSFSYQTKRSHSSAPKPWVAKYSKFANNNYDSLDVNRIVNVDTYGNPSNENDSNYNNGFMSRGDGLLNRGSQYNRNTQAGMKRRFNKSGAGDQYQGLSTSRFGLQNSSSFNNRAGYGNEFLSAASNLPRSLGQMESMISKELWYKEMERSRQEKQNFYKTMTCLEDESNVQTLQPSVSFEPPKDNINTQMQTGIDNNSSSSTAMNITEPLKKRDRAQEYILSMLEADDPFLEELEDIKKKSLQNTEGGRGNRRRRKKKKNHEDPPYSKPNLKSWQKEVDVIDLTSDIEDQNFRKELSVSPTPADRKYTLNLNATRAEEEATRDARADINQLPNKNLVIIKDEHFTEDPSEKAMLDARSDITKLNEETFSSTDDKLNVNGRTDAEIMGEYLAMNPDATHEEMIYLMECVEKKRKEKMASQKDMSAPSVDVIKPLSTSSKSKTASSSQIADLRRNHLTPHQKRRPPPPPVIHNRLLQKLPVHLSRMAKPLLPGVVRNFLHGTPSPLHTLPRNSPMFVQLSNAVQELRSEFGIEELFNNHSQNIDEENDDGEVPLRTKQFLARKGYNQPQRLHQRSYQTNIRQHYY